MLATDVKRPEIGGLRKRARMPAYFRAAAIAVLGLSVIGVIVAFVFARREPDFRLKPGDAKLSKDVTGEVTGYERTETEGDSRKYYVKADKATTFADNHQELENVFVEVFDDAKGVSDKITARKGLYIPAENKNFNAYFVGDVNIDTRDGLKVRTEQIYYKKETDTAEAEQLVEFERGSIAGKSTGAFVRIAEKRLELMKDVSIDAYAVDANDQLSRSKIKSANMTSDYAMVDQINEQIDLSGKVFIAVVPDQAADAMSQPTDIHADRASAGFEKREIRKIDLTGNVDIYQKATAANAKWTHTKAARATASVNGELKTAELFDNVDIETAGGDQKPTKINSAYALYDKDADRFNLRGDVRIVTIEDQKPTTATAAEAVYEQTAGRITMSGGAEIDTGVEFVKGDTMVAELYPSKKVRQANARGAAYLRQVSADRKTEVSATELSATFDDAQQMRSALAAGGASAVLTPTKQTEYTRVSMSAPRSISLAFRGAGLVERMTTDGRTTINLTAPDTSDDAANKRLTADSVQTFFNQNGKDISRAEAVGNAELYVEPRRASEKNFRTTVNAPRFDCEFFPTGNNARVCVGKTRTKTTRVPTAPKPGRGPQTLVADTLTAQFDEKTQDVRQFDATGNTRFAEVDRNGIADNITFTAEDETVRLRGGDPTIWDSAARARAPEIDWDTKNNRSSMRGGASTTYYSQKQTGGATPFGQTSKPVYVTAAEAQFDHVAETGVYTGNARAWQDNNYVRSDRLTIRQKEGRMTAEGNVQSVLYDAKKKDKGREQTVPVYASSAKMNYNRETRMLRYDENVDIRQGTDRITSGSAEIYLNERNEMSKTIAETGVVITQPSRRASGDWVQYTAADEVAILRGNPARVDDQENGASQGAQMTVYMRESRVIGESKTETVNTGRTRTVYKVKKN